MSFIGKAIGQLTGAGDAADAAQAAANTQAASAQAGIDEQKRQFDALQAMLKPFVEGGTSAFGAQQNLVGLNGSDAQRQALLGIEGSPQFASLMQQGENGILQNASATGGLRGGNVQGALAQFRPQMLQALIDQQYSRLGGLSGLGANAAAGVGSAGMQSGRTVAELLQQQGAATAGGQVAAGGVARQGFGDLLKIGAVIGGFF